MLTETQYARVPGILRDIVIHDRETAAIANVIAAAPVVAIGHGKHIRQRRALRDELRVKAHHLYGRTPLRGETGPGRPTAARA